jgi:hypothetical protein
MRPCDRIAFVDRDRVRPELKNLDQYLCRACLCSACEKDKQRRQYDDNCQFHKSTMGLSMVKMIKSCAGWNGPFAGRFSPTVPMVE